MLICEDCLQKLNNPKLRGLSGKWGKCHICGIEGICGEANDCDIVLEKNKD